MLLTNKQANERLNSEKNLALRFKKDNNSSFQNEVKPSSIISEVKPLISEVKPSPIISIDERTILSPGKNRINLTESERTEIAIRARSGSESQTQIARAMDVNVLTVGNIHHGKVKGIDEEKVEKVINQVKDRALDRLMQSLGLLTDDKLSGCSAKDLSVIASNMGRVVEKIQTKVETPDNINFIIYAPELKQEKSFDVVEI